MGKGKARPFDPKLAAVKLPPKLKCYRCEVWRTENSYSEKQKNIARESILYKGQSSPPNLVCNRCNGGPLVELECTSCNVTKGLEDFAKSQRAVADHAKCYECVEKHLDLNPIIDRTYENPLRSHAIGDYSDGREPNYWEDTASQTDSSIKDGYDSIDDHGGIALSANFQTMSIQGNSMVGELIPGLSSNSSTNGTAKMTGTKSWDSRSTYLSQNQDSNTAKTFNSSVAERSNLSQVKGSWAKIRAFTAKDDSIKPMADDDWDSDEDEQKLGNDDSSDDGYGEDDDVEI
ncbi:hypothetical protein BU24DRAFT_147018 [Aaosphaeria arxii CBS 175.79]|uniref:Stc1 domain-containing protein n=1 Tax=Aaosphaeria arxii CBS 175.79 TaxID=1450172 RepID=A0A6A5XVM5_9PLEO|nr:uncharacterized protein BU24DRAFT_147018 [Aaosphaeria arxii CBS 175.79]KAF2017262.1 hypothetical protein BU24DRAFT_147018 [Aaosphaeria arxii CBS 175.79]